MLICKKRPNKPGVSPMIGFLTCIYKSLGSSRIFKFTNQLL